MWKFLGLCLGIGSEITVWAKAVKMFFSEQTLVYVNQAFAWIDFLLFIPMHLIEYVFACFDLCILLGSSLFLVQNCNSFTYRRVSHFLCSMHKYQFSHCYDYQGQWAYLPQRKSPHETNGAIHSRRQLLCKPIMGWCVQSIVQLLCFSWYWGEKTQFYFLGMEVCFLSEPLNILGCYSACSLFHPEHKIEGNHNSIQEYLRSRGIDDTDHCHFWRSFNDLCQRPSCSSP